MFEILLDDNPFICFILSSLESIVNIAILIFCVFSTQKIFSFIAIDFVLKPIHNSLFKCHILSLPITVLIESLVLIYQQYFIYIDKMFKTQCLGFVFLYINIYKYNY